MNFLLLLACTSKAPVDPAMTLGRPSVGHPDGFVAGLDGVRGTGAGGRIHARFGGDGAVRLDDLQVRTLSFGRGDGSVSVASSEAVIGECDAVPCVKLELGGLTEWWTTHADGFEQGWSIRQAPIGVGEVTVDLALPGANVRLEGGEARIASAAGRSWTVSSLRAWDADGVALSSRFEAVPGGLRIAVDDTGARYPLQIDPMYSTPDYVLDGTTWIVAGGGDVNGDGYVDVVMSSHSFKYGTVDLYLGTSAGYDETMPDSQLAYLYDSAHLDYVPVAFAGDVNGDGYEEVIVSAPVDERVNVYAGGAEGLASFRPDPTWTLPEFAGHSPTGDVDPVASVAGAGDVNGDGYDDVIVGVAPQDAPGHATIYLGSSAGVRVDESAVELHAPRETGSADYFGYAVAGAGDVNGDGYDDVIVSGWYETVVFHGSATGVAVNGTVLVTPGASWAVAGAGDVNGDGYDDVIVGVPLLHAGYALVFLGSSGGVATAAAWQREGVDELDYDLYGYSVAGAGDVNGDGYDDIITGSEQIPDVFLGSAMGLEVDPVATLRYGGSSVSGAGDVDRDGFDDVVTGGGFVWLASTFLDPTKVDGYVDSNADADGDTGTASSGCTDGKAGCASVPARSIGAMLTVYALGLACARRRVQYNADRKIS